MRARACPAWPRCGSDTHQVEAVHPRQVVLEHVEREHSDKHHRRPRAARRTAALWIIDRKHACLRPSAGPAEMHAATSTRKPHLHARARSTCNEFFWCVRAGRVLEAGARAGASTKRRCGRPAAAPSSAASRRQPARASCAVAARRDNCTQCGAVSLRHGVAPKPRRHSARRSEAAGSAIVRACTQTNDGPIESVRSDHANGRADQGHATQHEKAREHLRPSRSAHHRARASRKSRVPQTMQASQRWL